jgi:nucleoid-associated protein YgaU
MQQPGFAESSADSVNQLQEQNTGDSADNAPVPAEGPVPALAEDAAPAFAEAPPVPAEDPAAQPDVGLEFRTVRVERGATLESLARDVYGGVDSALIRRIQAANPRVVDPNLIMAGDLLRFPEAEPEHPAAQKGELQ